MRVHFFASEVCLFSLLPSSLSFSQDNYKMHVAKSNIENFPEIREQPTTTNVTFDDQNDEIDIEFWRQRKLNDPFDL